jgi:hypothetical protein
MKIIITIIAFISLLYLPVVFAEDVSVDQLKQMMTASADNLTTYTYTRSTESTIIYSNESLQDKFAAVKATEGKVNLTAQSGWWSHRLTDTGNGQVLTWQGYFLNGTELWKEGENWTQFNITDPKAVMADYNELPGEAALLTYSNLSITGSEAIDGEDCYMLEAEPIPLIKETIWARRSLPPTSLRLSLCPTNSITRTSTWTIPLFRTTAMLVSQPGFPNRPLC